MKSFVKFLISFFAAESVVAFGLLFIDSRRLDLWWRTIDERPLENFPINVWAMYEGIDGGLDLFWPLYFLFPAFSLYFAWKNEDKDDYAFKQGAIFWSLNISVVAVWTYIYTSIQSLVVVIPIIIIALVLSDLTMRYFLRVSKLAGYLMLVPILFQIFSLYMYTHLLILNPQLL